MARNISLNAGRDLLQNAAVTTTVAGASIELAASGKLTMANGAVSSTSNGNMVLLAGTNATLTVLNAGNGSVSITAGNNIVDGAGTGAGTGAANVIAAGLLLHAGNGIGEGANALDTTVSTLTAQAGNGGLYLSESDGLTVATVQVQVNRVGADGAATVTANAAQGMLTASAAGNVVLVSNSGDLVINNTVGAVSGSVLLQAGAGNLTLNSAIQAGSGSVSLSASGFIAQKAAISTAGSVDLQAGGAITMDDGVLTSATGNIRYVAGSALTLGALSTSGNVSLSAERISDSGSNDTDVTANQLRLVTTGAGAGTGTAHLQVAVNTLAANVAGSLFLDATQDITVGAVDAIGVTRLAADGTTAQVSDASLSDLVSGGALVLVGAGTVTVNDGNGNLNGVTAAGNLLLQAATDLVVNAALLNNGANISLNAGRDLLQNAAVTTTVAGASIELAASGKLTMANGAVSNSNNGNMVLLAGTNATLTVLNAGNGSVSITAGNNIVDGAGTGAGTGAANVLAAGLLLHAGNGIGEGANALDTTVSTLTAQAGNGGLYLSESDGLTVATVQVQVNRVGADGAATVTANAAQGMLTASAAGNVVLVSNSGDLVINNTVGAVSGSVLLQAGAGNLTLNSSVTGGGARITLAASGLHRAKSVDVQHRQRQRRTCSAGGSIAMDDGALTRRMAMSVTGAAGTLTLGAISTSGNVSLSAGSISDSGSNDTDVTANQLRLVTSGAIAGAGTGAAHLQVAVNTLAANVAGSGGLYLDALGAITVDAVGAIGVSRLAADGNVALLTDAGIANLVSAGNLVLLGGAGTLAVNGASAMGNMLLKTTSPGTDLLLNGALQADGNISLDSARDIVQNGAITAAGTGSSIDLLAAGAITMGNTAVTASHAGTIRYAATGNVTLGLLDARSVADRLAVQLDGQAGWGEVSVSAGGAIVDSAAVPLAVYAGELRLVSATAGTAGNYLTVEAATLSAAVAGDLFVADSSALSLGATGAVALNRVGADGAVTVPGAADLAQAGLVVGGNAVVTAAGTLAADRAVTVSGNLLLSSGADIVVNAAVLSSGGYLSLAAARDIVQNAAIGTRTDGLTVDLLAGRDINMGEGSITSSNSGNIVLQAGNNVIIETLNAGSAAVSITAVGGSIVDQDGADDNSNGLADITAGALLLKAGNGIGSAASHLEISVATLSAVAGAGGLFVSESDGLTVGALAVQANRVDGAGLATATGNAAQSGLASAAAGAIVLTSVDGNITLDRAVNAAGSGNVLIAALGANADLVLNSSLTVGSGSVALQAGRGITLADSAVVSGASAGTLSFSAASGSITMAAAATVSAAASSLRLAAGADVVLGNVSAANVSVLTLSGSIASADGAASHVSATSLRLQAGQNIGAATHPVTTAATTLSAQAGGALYLSEADAVTLGTVAVVVNDVLRDGSLALVTDAAQSGLYAANIVLSTVNGGIALADGVAVRAADAGNILLQAQGVDSKLLLGSNSTLQSGSGHITLLAADTLGLAAGALVSTGLGGDIAVAAGGSIAQADGSLIANADGSIRVAAGNNVQLARITSNGEVAISAVSGTINDDGDAATDIVATGLSLSAGNGIGSPDLHGQPLGVAVGVLSASAGVAGISVAQRGDAVVGTVAVTVHTVGADGAVTLVNAPAQSGLRTVGGGAVVLGATGAIVLNDVVTADGSAAVRLTAGGGISANASLSSVGGTITVQAGGDVAFNGTAGIATGGSGNIGVTATGGSVRQTAGSLFAADAGSIGVTATGDVTLGLARTGGGVFVSTSAGTITGAAGSTVNVTASTLDMAAAGAIGSAGQRLGTAVDRLTATAGSVFINETDSMLVDVNTAAGNGDIALTAGGDVQVASLFAGSGNIAATAGASIVNLHGAGVAVRGGALSLNAGDGIGAGSQALTISVATLAATAGVGGMYLAESDGLTVGAVSVAGVSQSGLLSNGGNVVLVSTTGDLALVASVRTTGAGNVLLQASSGSLALNGGVTVAGSASLLAGAAISQNANVVAGGTLDAQAAGGITMTDGSVSRAANLRYGAGGDIVVGLLDARGGSVSLVAGGAIIDAQAATAVQTVNVSADALRMVAGNGIGVVGNALETAVGRLGVLATGGAIALLEADGVDVTAVGVAVAVNRVGATGASTVLADAALAGAVAPSGNIALESVTGSVVFGQPIATTPGRDLSVVGDSFVVNQTLTGQGGDLLVKPSNPALNVHIGGSAVAGALNIDHATLANISGGFGSVIIGGGAAAPGQDIVIDGSATPVVFNESLVLNVSGSGSVISVAGQLTAEALDARGAVLVDGAVTIAAGNGAVVAGGNMVFEQSIDGSGAHASLTLAAGGDSVVFGGAVGASAPLTALTIGNAADVTFSQTVVVDGALTINASGTVKFDSSLVLNGGSVVIRGASAVIVGEVVMTGTDGVFVIEANSLTLNGDVRGAAVAVLRPTDSALAVDVGGAGVAGAYTVSTAQLAHLASVGSLVIGTQGTDGHAAAGAGNVSVAAIDFAALTTAPIALYGANVTVVAGAGVLRAAAGITLDGRASVTVHDSLASASGDIAFYSANGSISMDAGALVSGTAQVTLQAAGNLDIGLLRGDNVVLRSTSGTIADAANDAAVNIVANTVAIYGYGPKLGTGHALEVQAPAVYVSAPAGMVLQDTGSDGRTHFYVLNGATMYEQVIGIGNVVRPTEDPSPAAPATSATMLSQWLSPTLVAQRLAQASTLAPSHLAARDTATVGGVAAYLGNVALGASDTGGLLQAGAQGMQRLGSFTLGSPGLQALSTGEAASDKVAFDFWLEDIVL